MLFRCSCHATAEAGRRGFLKLAALGAAIAVPMAVSGSMLPTPARAAGDTEALLLSCMDYRLTDDIVRYMGRRKLTDKYDHVVLAGASLGALTDKYPNWGKTFWDHLEVAIQLHHIHKVIVLDHRDCGAYKVFLGPDAVKDAATERSAHEKQLKALGAEIKQKHPKLATELLLMSLDGKVELIS
ncbi:MAG: hypothetical protein JNK11_16910 [Alphaproteobacteria bacterium]|nr:hypothetical protein [Alphaproteobacteria bacterium]